MTSSPWDETASRFAAMLEPESAHHPASQSSRASEDETGPERDSAQVAPAETARLTLPRLSELRGMNFTQALRGLDLSRRPLPPSAGIDVLMSAIAPFETLFAQFDSTQNGVSSAPPDPETDLLAAMSASYSAPEPQLAPEAPDEK